MNFFLIENAQPVRPWSIWLICILNYKWILRALSSNQVMRVDKKVNLIRQMNNSKVNFRVIITTFFNKFIYFQTRKSYTSSEIIAMIMRQLFSDICCTQKLVHILEWSWLIQNLMPHISCDSLSYSFFFLTDLQHFQLLFLLSFFQFLFLAVC